jgi:ABC-type multidrug transport system fused ATPase/permease subunit
MTLRASGYISQDIDKNTRLINTSQRPFYLLAMIQQWLSLVLNLLVVAMAAILTTLAVQLHSNSGFAGASLVTLMDFSIYLTGIIIFYTRLETSLGAIARLRKFNQSVEPEDKEGEDVQPPRQWPQNGVIELKGVSASYSSAEDADVPSLALRDIHLSIKQGEKVAICGRTGSGKSSLLALLLKLLDPLPGKDTIVIDDTALGGIDRATLRERIIAVPQEAVFLPDGSSFRANLDPFGLSSDDGQECQDVLRAVGLWDFVSARDGGVDGPMSPGSLSAGQRQLMSLCRALLRRRIRARDLGMGGGGGGSEGGILLLDEVSSSVDTETEKVMSDVIGEEFGKYTVVAVSHRLDMVMDFDRVVVMDKGAIVEVGNPHLLAADEGTRFGELIKASRR